MLTGHEPSEKSGGSEPYKKKTGRISPVGNSPDTIPMQFSLKGPSGVEVPVRPVDIQVSISGTESGPMAHLSFNVNLDYNQAMELLGRARRTDEI